jgi:hypothetical protein
MWQYWKFMGDSISSKSIMHLFSPNGQDPCPVSGDSQIATWVLWSASPTSYPSAAACDHLCRGSAHTNFPCFQRPHVTIFSYLVCCTCHVNLPPACRQPLCNAQAPNFILLPTLGTAEVATSKIKRLYLPVIAHVTHFWPSLLTRGVLYLVRRMLIEALIMQSILCYNYINRHWPFSLYVGPNQVI